MTNYPARNRLREEYGQGVRVAIQGKYLIFYAERDGLVVVSASSTARGILIGFSFRPETQGVGDYLGFYSKLC